MKMLLLQGNLEKLCGGKILSIVIFFFFPFSQDELQKLLELLKEQDPLVEEQLQKLCIEMNDFIVALSSVQPSAKREGFVTVPDVTWADIGALEDIREELAMVILVGMNTI